jgi:hypothetical protein
MDINNRFSDVLQQRINTLLSQADFIFAYQWLREKLHLELRNCLNNKGGYTYFTNRLHNEKEMLFVFEYFMSYKSTLDEIIDECQNPYVDEDVAVGLAKEREQLIIIYAQHPLSLQWSRVSSVFPDSWRAFAKRCKFDNEESLKDLRSFLRLVDKISLISDILNNREHRYGLEVNTSLYKRYVRGKDEQSDKTSREELKKLLIIAIDRCRGYFWANTSMGVVFSVCKEDYGFEDNASDFERFMQDVLAGLDQPLDYNCPSNTIASAKQSGKYLKYPISQWHIYQADDRAFSLLNKLREELSIAAKEQKGDMPDS